MYDQFKFVHVLFEVSKSEIHCGIILLSINHSIHHIPGPQMRADIHR